MITFVPANNTHLSELKKDLSHLIVPTKPKTPIYHSPKMMIESLMQAKDADETTRPEPARLVSSLLNLYATKGLTALAPLKGATGQGTDLLWAVADNDLPTVQAMLDQNFDVNVQGHLGETPLHIAATFGHTSMISLLLEHGADPSIKAYVTDWDPGFTALELAIQEHHKEIINLLLQQDYPEAMDGLNALITALDHNEAKAVLELLDQGVHLVAEAQDLQDLAWEKLFDFIEMIDLGYASQSELQAASECLIAIAEITGTALYDDPELALDFEIPPMGVLLELYASYMVSPALYMLLNQTATALNNIDDNRDIFVEAKSLFHIVPVDGTYSIAYDTQPYFTSQSFPLNAEGFHQLYTVPLLEKHVNLYIDQNPMGNPALEHAFESALSSIHLASSVVGQLALPASAASLFEAYEQGQTVLVPSGWEGHSIDLIFNKELGMVLIANQGQRHDAFESGVNIFNMHHPEQLTEDIIHELLINQDQMYLEMKVFFKLGLEAVDVIDEPNQFTGNCAWQSQESALEGLLYLDLMVQGLEHQEAVDLAHHAYLDWDLFQTNAFIDSYFSNDPRIPEKAMEDMIRTQAYLLGTDDLETLKLDSTGALLVAHYERLYDQDPALIALDYDPWVDFINNIDGILPLPVGSETELEAVDGFLSPEPHLSMLSALDITPPVEQF